VRSEILGTIYLLAPLLGGAFVHGLCMKYEWLAFLKRPIDGGRTWRGRPLFGRSKTWRGPLLVAAGAAGVWALQRHVLHGMPAFAALELVDYEQLPGAGFIALAGFAGELAELPNSFVKRRLGIAPGATAHGPLALLFYLWDQLDVLTGYGLVLTLAVPPTTLRVAVSVAAVAGVHPLLTWLGFLLRMRPTAR
jgi:CDP-2,3-bis-(O-geranylgeranyl)-sn-glycerol synthase